MFLTFRADFLMKSRFKFSGNLQMAHKGQVRENNVTM